MFSFLINRYLKKKPPSSEEIVGRNKTRLMMVHMRDEGDKASAEEEKKSSDEQMTISSSSSNHKKGGEDGGGGVSLARPAQDQDQDPGQDQEDCCSTPCCLGLTAGTIDHSHYRSSATTMRIARANFAKSTTSSIFPDTQFTNHESLPCLSDALSGFLRTYPQYKDTQEADNIRQHHYSHLSHHVCLDYTGFTLFSHSQLLLQPLLQQQASSSSSSLPPLASAQPPPPFFAISYRSACSLASQVQYDNGSTGNQEMVTGFESAIRNRIMSFLNLSPEDYAMVFTANRTSAFKLLVDAYPFHASKRLLTVYDHECEAVSAMRERAVKRGAKVMSASFCWPNLRIQSAKLKRILVDKKQNKKKNEDINNSNKKNNNSNGKKKKKKRGLFVFPLQSRMTGTRYPYLWMRFAQENGWHVVLDACALGPKDLDTLGLSLIQPDFIICSFYKVVGENPSGFASLLIKKSSCPGLSEASVMGSSIGVISIGPPKALTTTRRLSQLNDTHDHDETDLSATFSDIGATASSFSAGPILSPSQDLCNTVNGSASKNIIYNVPADCWQNWRSGEAQMDRFEQGETSSIPCQSSSVAKKEDEEKASEIVELESNITSTYQADRRNTAGQTGMAESIDCLGLDHADSLGLVLISSRLRFITNWLVMALTKLRHPNSENGHPLVRTYGPRIKFERGASIAFNVFDWKGEKVEPALVQKLADRCNISLSCGFLHNIWFSDEYEGERDAVLEKRNLTSVTATSAAASSASTSVFASSGHNKRKDDHIDLGIAVVNASLGFLTSFEDAYKLWSFVARFLDADFVEKERWRYMALNQKMIEV